MVFTYARITSTLTQIPSSKMTINPNEQHEADPTYRNYTPSQATTYSKSRPSPPPALVKLILDHHTSTGGRTGKLLDVGCGPGMATRALAKHFDVAIGSDAGESMIRVAEELGGETAKDDKIRWVVCPAEGVDEIDGLGGEGGGSVDLVIGAYAVSSVSFVIPLGYFTSSISGGFFFRLFG